MKSLFDEDAYEDIKKRLMTLTPTHSPRWGKMTVAQMLAHCQFPLEIALSEKPRRRMINPLPLLFKKSMYSDTPWRKNLPTVKAAKITEKKDFVMERSALLDMIDSFYQLKNKTSWQPHPMFGHFKTSQWGMMEYKHLDHHLTQFGV